MKIHHSFSIRNFIKENRLFFYVYSVFLVLGLAWLIIAPKGLLLIVLNQSHTDFFDFFFYYATMIGDGIFIVLASLPLLYISIRAFTFSISSFALSGLLSQAIKFLLSFPRPYSWFADTSSFHFVPGVNILSDNSMPSGHTATAFAFFLALAITFRSKRLSIIFILLAILVGISRIYLFQHFFEDVFAGALLGVLSVVLLQFIFTNYIKESKSGKFERPMFRKE